MVIVNSMLPSETLARLKKITDSVFPVPRAPRLPAGLSAHPDMLIHVSPKAPVCAPFLLPALRAAGVNAIAGTAEPEDEYPRDIRYNCFSVGGALICNEKYTDGAIKKIYESAGAPIYNCRQGYASCSALRVNGGVITADKNVAASAKKAGADVLLISAGSIRLDGYSCGFIGGCGGTVGKNLLLFGNPLTRPDGEKIAAFAEKHGAEILPLSDGTLTDYGGIIEINP